MKINKMYTLTEGLNIRIDGSYISLNVYTLYGDKKMENEKLNGIIEINKIFRMEVEEDKRRWECCFCGLIRREPEKLIMHILKHLKEVMPICGECGVQHIPDSWDDRFEIIDEHTQMYFGR
jgi:hypothetical protein